MPYAEWGEMLVETDVDRAVLTTLSLWLPTYLAQAERERDLTNRLLARPHEGSYSNALEDDEFPDGRLPAVICTTAQVEGTPEKTMDRDYYAAWQTTVSVLVRGRTPPETREVAAVFGGCIRRILIQQQLPDIEGEIIWTGGEVAPYLDLTGAGRYLAAGVNTFLVYADHVITGDGPVIPDDDDPPYPAPDPSGDPDDPYDPLANITSVTTTITAR